MTAHLRGSTPIRTYVQLTAGSVDLRLPDDEYRELYRDLVLVRRIDIDSAGASGLTVAQPW